MSFFDLGLTHNVFYSNCETLDVGCSLKKFSNNVWKNADTWSEFRSYPGGSGTFYVYDGKFSDGIYCYTVVDGIITTKNLCRVDVFLNLCSDTTADGSGYVSVRAQAQDTSNYALGNLITLNTSVTIDFVIEGADIPGQISDSITITGGSSNYGFIGFGPGFGVGEPVSTLTITGITYSSGSAGNQVYQAGSTNIGC